MRAGDRPRRSRGFSFVAVLVLLALCMLGLGVAGPLWSARSRRDRETELLRVGALYAQALASYHDRAPGSLKQFPARLDDLLADARYVGTMRHLRRLYADPIDPAQPWGLVLDADQRITGVYSRSDAAPLREGPVDLGNVLLPAATHYRDWIFTPRASASTSTSTSTSSAANASTSIVAASSS